MPLSTDDIATLIDLNSGRNATSSQQVRVFESVAGSGVPVSGDPTLSGALPPESASDGVNVGTNQLAVVQIKLNENPRRPASWFYISEALSGQTYDIEIDGTTYSYVAQPGDTIADIASELDALIEVDSFTVNQFSLVESSDLNRVFSTGSITPGDPYVQPPLTTTQSAIAIYSDAAEVTFVPWGLFAGTWYRIGDFEKTVTDNYAELFGCSAYTRLYIQVTSISGTVTDAGLVELLVAPCDEQAGGGFISQ